VTRPSAIRIGKCRVKTTKLAVQRFKAILDKLEVPHVLDNVGFHNTLADQFRMKSFHNTKVWKVEKDGSVSLKNRFGHSGRFDYRYLIVKSLLEFQFVDLSILSREEADFLSSQIYEFEFMSNLSATAG
jgi:hypothetical protein